MGLGFWGEILQESSWEIGGGTKRFVLYLRETYSPAMPDSPKPRLVVFSLLFAVFLLAFMPQPLACGCDAGNRDMPFHERYARADAILLGVLSGQNILTDIYPAGWAQNQRVKYFNLRLLSYSKYTQPCADLVTLVDSGTDSSCEGFLASCQIGDTILVYCRISQNLVLGAPMFHGNMCEPYSILSNVEGKWRVEMKASDEEIAFIKEAEHWKKPQQVKRFGLIQNQPQIENPPSSSKKTPSSVYLVASIALNFLLLFLIFRKSNLGK